MPLLPPPAPPPAIQSVEQIAPALPPAAATRVDQPGPARNADPAVAQLPPDPRRVIQPEPRTAQLHPDTATDDAGTYVAVIAPDRGSVPDATARLIGLDALSRAAGNPLARAPAGTSIPEPAKKP